MENLDASNLKAQHLLDSLRGAYPDVLKQLELASGQLSTDQDFHFYSNFKEFKKPVKDIQNRVVSLLSQISALKCIRSSSSSWPADSEEAYDWLVGVQDDLLERVDAFLDESHVERKESKQLSHELATVQASASQAWTSPRDVKVAKKDKDGASIRSPVPFHVRNIPRPQDKFDIAVDNSNSPFKHPCRSTRNSQDEAVSFGADSGSTHPLEVELKEMAFMEPLSEPIEPREPCSLQDTPFTYVDNLHSLKDMADKLRAAAEIAVDLEHHHYRSFQGFVCLMQVSTRLEDFVIDTLALRSHIYPYLGDIFSDPKILKVIHGADRDIVWLQCDFGIYVCNMFDTGQAARVLQLPSAGLAFLLEHFCGVTADKRYQLSDWRLRPLPAEMMKYAREDTHYLLYVHDLLKQQLLALRASADFDGEDPYVQVCRRSRDICWQLYTKELYTETSFLRLHGLYDKQFRPDQLAAVAKLYAWRDQLARKDDESTGYVLPNYLLLQLATEMPVNVRQLQMIAKVGPNSYVGRNAGVLVALIREAKENPLHTPLPPRSKHGLEDSKLQEEAVEKAEEVGASVIFTSEDGDELEGLEVGAIKQEVAEARLSTGDVPSQLVQTQGSAVVSRKAGSMLFSSRRSKSTAVLSSQIFSSIPPSVETSVSAAQLESGIQTPGCNASHRETQTPTRSVPEVKLQRKIKGVGASLFSGSRQQCEGECRPETFPYQVQARLKAQAVGSSIALPFKTTTPVNQAVCSANRSVEAPENVDSEDNLPEQGGISARPDQSAVLGDVIMLESDDWGNDDLPDNITDQERRRKWWPPGRGEEGTEAGASGGSVDLKGKRPKGVEASETGADERNPTFPPSLSETHGTHRRRKRNRVGVAVPNGVTGTPNSGEGTHQRKKSKVDQPNSSKAIDLDAVNGSFDYAEARKRLGVDNLYAAKVDEQGKSGRSKGKYNKKPITRNKNLSLGFDALRRVRADPKPEGIPKAPRRQVYSMTGNRSATFKK